jgi:hypothetical protein
MNKPTKYFNHIYIDGNGVYHGITLLLPINEFNVGTQFDSCTIDNKGMRFESENSKLSLTWEQLGKIHYF